MAFQPNYKHQRNERARAKEQKKQEKLQRRQEEAARRKAAGETGEEQPGEEAEASTAGDGDETGVAETPATEGRWDGQEGESAWPGRSGSAEKTEEPRVGQECVGTV